VSGFFRRFAQTDEERLTEEVQSWAGSVPDTERIGSVPEREQVRIAGVVRRLMLRPAEGRLSFAVLVTDGTGELTAVWTGRDQIPGLRLGTRVILEGLTSRERGGDLRLVNPRYEFA
jgi:RecG-like helicase